MWARRELFVLLAIVSLTLAGTAAVYVVSQNPSTGLLPFSTYAELAGYIDQARSSEQSSFASGGLMASPSRGTPAPVAGAPAAGASPSAPAYSGTNVQVAGVDELDMVKTDGTYIYIASQDSVSILLAYPAASMRVVSRIALGNETAALMGGNASASVTGLFLDGSRLVVVGQAFLTGGYGTGTWGAVGGGPALVARLSPVYPAPERTFAFLFDVSDPATPVLLHSVSVTGWTSTGRMVGGIVYLVATEWIPAVNGTYLLPQACTDGTCTTLAPDQVYHDPESIDPWDYTNVLAVNVTTAASNVMSIITGGWSVLYMSPSAMYLAFYKWIAVPLMVSGPLIPQSNSGWTTIYKLSTEGLAIAASGSGNVPGTLLNQYAMDEWNGYLRVATTVRSFTQDTTSVSNGVYVFDGEMRLVGSVAGMAPGESIFAVRFVEDRAYVVTYRNIDPLFVIDLSDPAHPSVSGYLEMPGFSDYLYPLDANHLIGLGKAATGPISDNWSWYQGLKLALYNVTDPTAPRETANVTIGDRGSDSAALYDPHAFLYIPSREYVVLPVDLALVNTSLYPGGVPVWAWGDIVWQGVYLYRVNATAGIREVGRIAQGNGTVNATCGWYGSPNGIQRSLYIGDVLYTISATEVMANSLADLSEISSVVYASTVTLGYGCPVIAPVAVA